MTQLSDVLATVGPRLRVLRQRHGSTLEQVAVVTGISVSTLSRLESGARRPTLELLIPLARFHGIGIDELVEPAAQVDPRVRRTPVRVHDRLFQPLTRDAGAVGASGLQAFKMVLPPGPAASPEQQSHEGYDWFYVLTGRVRLHLGERELVLVPGEAAEFDTRVPHAIANAGGRRAELLVLFGPAGERVHVRVRQRREAAGPASA